VSEKPFLYADYASVPAIKIEKPPEKFIRKQNDIILSRKKLILPNSELSHIPSFLPSHHLIIQT